MEANNGNLVTAPGESDPQVPAVGSEQVGSRGSSSIDHRTTGVDSQAPVSLKTTSAATGASNKDPKHSSSSGSIGSLVSAMSSLKSQIIGQQGALSLMLEKASALEIMSTKTKSPQVQIAIEGVLKTIELVSNSHDSIVKAFKISTRLTQDHAGECAQLSKIMAKHPAKSAASQTDPPVQGGECHAASREASTNTSQSIGEPVSYENPRRQSQQQPERQREQRAQPPLQTRQRRRKQKHPMTPVNPEPDPKGTVTEEWSAVTRKPRKPKPPAENSGRQDPSNRPKRPPPDAIAIKPSSKHTFADILKAVREVDVDKTGAHITSIAESRGGEVLVKVTRGESQRIGLEAAIRDALGDRATVRGLVSYVDLDITGLDGVTTDTEVADALKKAAGLPLNDTSVRVKNVRPAHNGTRRATASLRRVDVPGIIKAGKVRIGLVWAKVRLREKIVR
ncbi:hypothetical protein AGLY_011561 [Aphis glycines]|uniref:Gag-like protein n=1 Tax=Aphis glycines TaxID=307491 RepID=A0A6G0TD80_APHGL|nr:hypothetical protein AGLY_011561 [Aphis glycines]